MDHYRELRHGSQYSTAFITTKEEAQKSIAKAKEFLERIEALFNKISNKEGEGKSSK